MRLGRLVMALGLLLAACGGDQARPLSETGEKLYALRGTVVGSDAGDNTLRISHEAVPGFMEAMTMDFTVRGAEVAALPASGTRIAARLHVTDKAYWLTDVERRE